MTAHAIPRPKSRTRLLPRPRHRASRNLALPLISLGALGVAAVAFVSYVLWPTWPGAKSALGAPALPVIVAGVLFDVPPGAFRTPVQRHPGTHDRIDLVFLWPSLATPPPDGEAAAAIAVHAEGDELPAPAPADRLFVTIAGLGAVLPPSERLRSIYPRYFETQAATGPDGLAILPFRTGTPYEGEDLVYFADRPEQFFARCTRPQRTMPGTCVHERMLDAAEIMFRFPRDWLRDWRSAAAGFDRLVTDLHQQADDRKRR